MKNAAWILLLVLAAGLGAIWAEIVPVRWDAAEAELPVVASSDWASMDALRLRPLDNPPVTCAADTVGTIYVQTKPATVTDPRKQFICWCVLIDVTYKWSWFNTSQVGGECEFL